MPQFAQSLAADPAPAVAPAGAATTGAATAAEGPLKSYIAKPDKSYRWVKRREGTFGGGKWVELTLTSQTWKSIVWKHQLFVYCPSQTTNAAQGLLIIGGGRWRPELEKPAPTDTQLPDGAQQIIALADRLKAPVAVLLQVPQQPIFGGLVEDQIISFTFMQFFIHGDPEWLALLPMTKIAVRAMDAVHEFCAKEWSLDVLHFTVNGASKRGWTTWLAAAVDPRVNSLAPQVIDLLNFEPQMKHQTETFGKYSEQLRDYTDKGLQGLLSTPQGRRLAAIVDPYSYRETIRQPKIMLLGTNDRYWPLDALNIYWDGLQGEKHVCYVPNNGHGLHDTAARTRGVVRLAPRGDRWKTASQFLGRSNGGARKDVAETHVRRPAATGASMDCNRRNARLPRFKMGIAPGGESRRSLPVRSGAARHRVRRDLR